MNSGLALRAHRTLNRIAFSLMHSFAWIFVFLYFSSLVGMEGGLVRTVMLYALSQVTLILMVPFALKHLRHGMKRGIVYGTVFASIAFTILGLLLIGYQQIDVSFALIGFAIALGAYRGMYRIPYEIETHYNTTLVSGESAVLYDTFIALMPALAGFFIVTYVGSFLWMLLTVALLLILSLIPLAAVNNVYENFSWGYRETFSNLFSRKHRQLVLIQFYNGVESAVLVLIWPITIFILVGFSFLIFGAILSLTFLGSLVARYFARNIPLEHSVKHSTVVEIAIAFSAWVARLAVLSPFSIVLVDVYSKIKGTRYDDFAVLYEHTVDKGLYLDEYTALKEVAHALGKIVVLLVAAFLAGFFSLPTVLILLFVIAGVAAGFSIRTSSLPQHSI